MGNVQSDIISSDNGGRQASAPKGAAKTATNDYDPSGEVIPDVTPFELLRTIMKLEKFERCLSCVPLNIDPRSPTSLKRDIDIALAELVAANENENGGGAAKKGGKGGVTADMNDVDVMSTIEEGDDDDESTAFNIDEKLREQQQYDDSNNTDAWTPAQVNKDDPSADLWHSNAPSNQDGGVNKSTSVGSGEFPDFNPGKSSEGDYGSAEYTEFDPDAILDAEEEQQQQQPVLSDELDDVLMMRSADDNCEPYDEPSSQESPTEAPSQQFIGLTDPMDVAQRACNAISQTNAKDVSERYQFMDELDDVEQLVDEADQLDANGDDDYYHEEDNNSLHSENEDEEKEESGSNQFDWTVKTENDMHQMDWRDNHQLAITEVGDANKIANKHFDDIISDFELSPQTTSREKAYSNVRSFKTQRAQKQRRSRRKNDTYADDRISKTIYSPQTSNAAFFAEETTVGRKLNGISPKARAVYYDTTPSDEAEKIPDPVTPSTNADAMNQNQFQDYSSYPHDGADTDEQYVMDASVGDCYSSAVVDGNDQEEDENNSYSSYHGDTGTDVNVIETTASDSYSADETATESVNTSEKEQKIVSDLSGESSAASSTFEATHAKLKGLLTRASYESESVNDSVNWDNLAYSMSDGSTANKKKGGYSFDEVMATRKSSEDEGCDQSSQPVYFESSKVNALHGNEENVTPTLTTKDMEDKIKQMKKQHEDEMKSYVNESHNTPKHQRYIEVQRRIDAMREQHKTNIDNMRAALKESDEHRNPPSSGRNMSDNSPDSSSHRFNFDDNVISKIDTREKSVQELMKQNAKLEEEMMLIRSLSPKSPDSFKFNSKSVSGSNAFSLKTYSHHTTRGYSPSIESPTAPAVARDEPEAYEARETLSTMILEANADEEEMNTRVNGMIADIKSFLQENDKVQERLSNDIISYGV
eukprot:scaffold1397_cov124-Skeletonema_dohrnii-CCMP3373.AAC.5